MTARIAYLTLYLFGVCATAKPQDPAKNWPWAFLPDGTELKGPFHRIADVLDTIGLKEHYSHSCNNPPGKVYFQALTRTPRAVIFIDGPMPEKIPAMIKSFDARKYFYSHSYFADLMDMVKRRTLTHEYIKQHMPPPDTLETWPDGRAVRLRFKEQNLIFTIAHNGLISNLEIIDFASIEKYRLALSEKKVIGSSYAIGFSMSIHNRAKKVIKYVHAHVTAFNRVDDKVGSTVAKCIGPIEPDGSASVEFPNLIYSSTADWLRFDKITITYMDGTTSTIPGLDVERVTLMDWASMDDRR